MLNTVTSARNAPRLVSSAMPSAAFKTLSGCLQPEFRTTRCCKKCVSRVVEIRTFRGRVTGGNGSVRELSTARVDCYVMFSVHFTMGEQSTQQHSEAEVVHPQLHEGYFSCGDKVSLEHRKHNVPSEMHIPISRSCSGRPLGRRSVSGHLKWGSIRWSR